MAKFVVYGDCQMAGPLTLADLEGFNGHYRPDDEEGCVWTEETDPSLLRVAVDVEACDYEASARAAVVELRAALDASGLTGRVERVTSCTDEGQATWEGGHVPS